MAELGIVLDLKAFSFEFLVKVLTFCGTVSSLLTSTLSTLKRLASFAEGLEVSFFIKVANSLILSYRIEIWQLGCSDTF